jgi:hypothetical protein
MIDHPADASYTLSKDMSRRVVASGNGFLIYVVDPSTGKIALGAENAAQHVIRGDVYRTNEDTLFTLLQTMATALATFMGSTSTATTAAQIAAAATAFIGSASPATALATGVTTFQNDDSEYLAEPPNGAEVVVP